MVGNLTCTKINSILNGTIVVTQPTSTPSYKILTVDGYWGTDTTTRLQQYF
jgi:hypothetical protein